MYGRFHTISRKEGDRWKILSDFAPGGEEPPDEEDFRSTHDMNDVMPFRCYMTYPGKKREYGG